MESIVLTLSIGDIFGNLRSIKQLLIHNDPLQKKFNDMVLRQYIKIITIRETIVIGHQLDIIETKLIKFGEKLDKLQKDIIQGQYNILMRNTKSKKSFIVMLSVDDIECDKISEITTKIKIMFYLFFFVYVLDDSSIDKTLILEQDALLADELYSQLKYWQTISPERIYIVFDIFLKVISNLGVYIRQREIVNKSLVIITELTVRIELQILTVPIDSEKNCLEVWKEITSPLSVIGINIERLKFHINSNTKKLHLINNLEENLKILHSAKIIYIMDMERIVQLFHLVSDMKQTLNSLTVLATKKYAEISGTDII